MNRLRQPTSLYLLHRCAWMACVASLVLLGCETEVAAVSGSDRAYTLYGVFTPQSDTQEVIVFPVEARLVPRGSDALDAQVTTTDLTTGELRVWEDSVVLEPTGLYEHVFWSDFTAEYGHTYRIEVKRSDGATSTAQVTVPADVELLPQEAYATPTIVLPVLARGPAPHLLNVEVEYYVKFADGEVSETTARLTIPYDGKETQVEDGWLIPISLTGDRKQIVSTVSPRPSYDPAYGILLIEMTLRILVASEDWAPPGGTFDPEVLVQPGVMSNVENGFGFIGGGFRKEIHWVPPPHILSAAGFRGVSD